MAQEKNKKGLIVFILTILIGLGFQLIPEIFQMHQTWQIIGTIWNAALCSLVGYFLLGDRFKEQFKHFKWKVLAWGLPLTFAVGIGGGIIYRAIFGSATQNNIADVLTIQMVLIQVPFMLLGEELLSTNTILALEEMGLSFKWASIICGILFALWHIPAYGPNILQLLITLMPVRLAMNYIWKKSKSVWVSWICHFIYDCVGFIGYLSK